MRIYSGKSTVALAAQSALTVLGNNTGSNAVPTALSIAQVITLLGGSTGSGGLALANSPTFTGNIVAGNVKSVLLGKLIGADMNTANDQAITISSSKWIARQVVLCNASIPLTLSVGGIYTGSNKTGSAIIGSNQVYSSLTGSSKL